VVDWVLVLKNGMVGGRDKSSYIVPELCLLSKGVESLFSFSENAVVAIDIEDLLRLWREVRLSSRGFISGGMLEILWKVMAR